MDSMIGMIEHSKKRRSMWSPPTPRMCVCVLAASILWSMHRSQGSAADEGRLCEEHHVGSDPMTIRWSKWKHKHSICAPCVCVCVCVNTLQYLPTHISNHQFGLPAANHLKLVWDFSPFMSVVTPCDMCTHTLHTKTPPVYLPQACSLLQRWNTHNKEELIRLKTRK